MERHQCKLCTRTFINGRALGGHMKAHLATFPLPPKTPVTLGDRTDSASSSSSSSGEEEELEDKSVSRDVEEKSLVYGLRENPKKSFRLADPEFAFVVDSGSVVQDRGSETESRNPTRRRSKRNRKPGVLKNQNENLEAKKQKLKSPSWVELPAEPEPASSVSDTSPEEDVAVCLMMLSRNAWKERNEERQDQERAEKEEEKQVEILEEPEEIKPNRTRRKYQCGKCNVVFRSPHALGGHKRICLGAGKVTTAKKIFECPFCCRVFASGQALGGHKRSHLLGSSSSTATDFDFVEFKSKFIDLNLPAPLDDDDFSVVSDA